MRGPRPFSCDRHARAARNNDRMAAIEHPTTRAMTRKSAMEPTMQQVSRDYKQHALNRARGAFNRVFPRSRDFSNGKPGASIASLHMQEEVCKRSTSVSSHWL